MVIFRYKDITIFLSTYMNTLNVTKNLKKALFFWQEICFIALLAFMLISMLVGSVINSAFRWDAFNSVFFCLFGLFLISYVGQLFWKNAGVAFVQSVLCGFASVLMLLIVSGYQMAEKGMAPADFWLMLALCLLYLAASVTMSVKYLRA